MSRRLHLGISTCPNDTFAFHALMEGAVDRRGLMPEVELMDVEELNQGLERGLFDAAKCSFIQAARLSHQVVVLPAGSALGFGVGPVLLSAPEETLSRRRAAGEETLVLCPGAHTTAHMLYRLFHTGEGRIEQRVFSEIMPALSRGEADRGVCIHEGRFTFEDQGLLMVEDLGERWERATDLPLPLGGIVARRSLGPEVHATLAAVIRDSVAWARAHPHRTLPTMRRHAQETSDDVLWKHVHLYVNEWTLDLGPQGRSALATFAALAREGGLLRPSQAPLQIL